MNKRCYFSLNQGQFSLENLNTAYNLYKRPDKIWHTYNTDAN